MLNVPMWVGCKRGSGFILYAAAAMIVAAAAAVPTCIIVTGAGITMNAELAASVYALIVAA